jgi:uncharacterized protein YjiS (DUF1127 family)
VVEMMMSAFESVRDPTTLLATDRAGKGLARFFRRLAVAFAVSRERRALAALSDETLKDIGLSRADTYRESTRSFWDLPADRMR